MTTIIYEEQQFEELSRNIHAKVEEIREPKYASLLGVKMNNLDPEVTVISTHRDIYDLLDNPVNLNKANDGKYDLIAVLTAGWAAPTDSHTHLPPSEHPERRRVKMTMVGNTTSQYGSLLSFDNDDDVMYDNMNASGALAEAFQEFVANWRND